MQILKLKLSLVFFLSVFFAQILLIGVKAAKLPLCPEGSKDCEQIITSNKLFDSESEVSANYLPILPLRAMVQANVYKEKKSLTLDRRYYIKNGVGDYTEYQKTFLHITIKGSGIIGREINAEGTLNDYHLKYKNVMKFGLPKRAHMKINATLDGITILQLAVQSDGDKMTNKVSGTYLGKAVDYQTNWRETKGQLAGIPYQLHTEGLIKEKDAFKAITKGTIGSSSIHGEVNMIKPNLFESVEYYGPIMVKTEIIVLEKTKS